MDFERHPRELEPPIEETLEGLSEPWQKTKQKVFDVIDALKGPVGRRIAEHRYGTEEDRKAAYRELFDSADTYMNDPSLSSSAATMRAPHGWSEVRAVREIDSSESSKIQVSIRTFGYGTDAHIAALVVINSEFATKHWTPHYLSGGAFQPYSDPVTPEGHLRHAPLTVTEAQAFAQYFNNPSADNHRADTPIDF